MALVLADRIQETASAPGTATVTLGGASLGYKTFASGVGSGNTTYYTIVDATANVWEVGVGTVGTGTLSRDTVLSNSSGTTAKINFANSVTVWCDYPAGKSVYLDGSNVLTLSVPEVISVNSASDALRITQTGAGNALLVEDSANPDATPFVINTDGRVVIGSTTTRLIGSDATPFLIDGVDYTGSSPAFVCNVNSANPVLLSLCKTRSAAAGGVTIVQSGDNIGRIDFRGADGTALIQAASIQAAVDGTPGTNDMPGRLVFGTTADGASSPTERMRITSSGAVGIGTALTQVNLYNTRNLSGNATSYGNYLQATVQSDVTSAAHGYRSALSTAASAFTVGAIYNFYANQGTIGAGSSITNQFGFVADSTLTGATNNYGFYSNIASGTGRYNFYAAGSASNYFGGSVGIGTTTLSDSALAISKPITGSAYATCVTAQSLVQSDVTGSTIYFNAVTGTAAAAFSTIISGFAAQQGTFGAGSTVTGQYGFNATSGLTGATNNYGFYSAIASGTGRYNFYAAGTADNYFAGRVGIGATANAGQSVRIGGNITGATSSYSMVSNGSVQSDVTSSGYGFASIIGTQATTFTTTAVTQFMAKQGTFGAGSTVTNQYGFQVDSNLTGATNNYGFYSNIASGTGRYNFYAAGTADNYFAGTVTSNATLQGSAVSASNGLFVNNNTVSANYSIPSSYNASSAGPVTVASGITVTIPSGSNWVII